MQDVKVRDSFVESVIGILAGSSDNTAELLCSLIPSCIDVAATGFCEDKVTEGCLWRGDRSCRARICESIEIACNESAFDFEWRQQLSPLAVLALKSRYMGSQRV